MHTTSRIHARFRIADPEIALSVVLIGVAFLFAALLVISGHATVSMSRYLFLRVDLPGMALAAVALVGIWAARRLFQSASDRIAGVVRRVRPWHVAIAMLAVMVAGVSAVHHDHPFSMDEYMTRFQGHIFASGEVTGTIPPDWREDARSLHHNFASINPANGKVNSGYRPGMAALHALFDLFGLGSYVSAVLSALAVILVAAVARRVWPASREAPLVAAVLLATSQQVLALGLTSYAMSAHLFFNLLWLSLFLRDDRLGHALAPIVAVMTAGLHQVHIHIFFALPFLLTLLRPPRLALLSYYGVIYVGGHLAVISWGWGILGGAGSASAAAQGAGALASLSGHVESLVRLPGTFELASVFANLARFLAWQNLAVPALIVFALWRGAALPPAIRLSIASLVVSLLPYLFLMPDQGHGWGYRYLHGLIGNMALIGTAGWLAIRRRDEGARRRAMAFVAAATAATLFVIVPYRAVQIEQVVRPFADAQAALAAYDADVVAVDGDAVFYGWDLVRNDPFLRNRPVIVNLDRIDPRRLERLCRRHTVKIVGGAELARFGLAVNRAATPPRIPTACLPGAPPTLPPPPTP